MWKYANWRSVDCMRDDMISHSSICESMLTEGMLTVWEMIYYVKS